MPPWRAQALLYKELYLERSSGYQSLAQSPGIVSIVRYAIERRLGSSQDGLHRDRSFRLVEGEGVKVGAHRLFVDSRGLLLFVAHRWVHSPLSRIVFVRRIESTGCCPSVS
jgi:hypothetical protein